MKKLLIPILVMIIFTSSVFADDLFSGEVRDNVPFMVDGVSHIAKYYPSAKKISISAGEERVLVGLADCEDLNGLKYCLDTVEAVYDDITGDPGSISTLRIIGSGPVLSISRDISTNSPLLNEEVDIITTITNTGNERAHGILFTDTFPISVKISSAALASLNNQVAWSGALNPEESATVRYKIRFTDFIEYASQAQASYYFGDKVSTKKSEIEEFSVDKPYSFQNSVSLTSVAEGEPITYGFNISNEDAATALDVTTTISIPSGFTVIRRDAALKETDGKYVYSEKIAASGSASLSLTMMSNKKGESTLSVNTALRSGTISFNEAFTQKLRVGISNIVPSINITPDPVKGGRELAIEAKITNTDAAKISDIWLDMESNFLDASSWRTLAIEPGKKYYAFNKIISAPVVENITEYYIKLSGFYKNAAGKTLTYEEKKTFTVTPTEVVVQMTPEIIVDGRQANITLKVKSTANYRLESVSFIDTIPKGFSMVAGERYIDLEEMEPGEERTAYSYIVKAPDTFSGKDFTVTHLFSAKDQSKQQISFEKKSVVTLGSAKPASSAAQSEDAETASGDATDTGPSANESNAEPTDTAKPNIFKRMWSWVKGLFGGADEEEKSETLDSSSAKE